MKRYNESFVYLILEILLIGIIVILSSCGEDPMSKNPINDPSKISPTITLTRLRDLGKNVSQSAEAWIFSAAHPLNTCKIEDGGVSVNGVDMDILYDPLGAPYYKASGNLGLTIGETSIVTVTLSNGNTYNSTVRIQEKELVTLDFQSPHSPVEDLQINWEETDTLYPMEIELSYEIGDSSGIFSIDIPDSSLSTGNFSIPSSYFSNLAGSTIELNLQSTKQGVANSAFHSGLIQSLMVIKKNCIIE